MRIEGNILVEAARAVERYVKKHQIYSFNVGVVFHSAIIVRIVPKEGLQLEPEEIILDSKPLDWV